MGNIKYILSNKDEPYYNLAFEQCLLKKVEAETVIIFLWQNNNTIVLGRNQDAFAECKVDEFVQSGGRVARRYSGGGAVFHDMGNLCFSVICMDKTRGDMFCRKTMTDVLACYGKKADWNGKNDFLVDGRKISGNADYSDGRAFCRHGTLLVSCDIKKMMYYLTPSASKLNKNHVKSISSRVINLDEIIPGIDISSIREAFVRTTGAEVLYWTPSEGEINLFKKRFESNEWIFGGKV